MSDKLEYLLVVAAKLEGRIEQVKDILGAEIVKPEYHSLLVAQINNLQEQLAELKLKGER